MTLNPTFEVLNESSETTLTAAAMPLPRQPVALEATTATPAALCPTRLALATLPAALVHPLLMLTPLLPPLPALLPQLRLASLPRRQRAVLQPPPTLSLPLPTQRPPRSLLPPS